jgi:hypothetical protein
MASLTMQLADLQQQVGQLAPISLSLSTCLQARLNVLYTLLFLKQLTTMPHLLRSKDVRCRCPGRTSAPQA